MFLGGKGDWIHVHKQTDHTERERTECHPQDLNEDQGLDGTCDDGNVDRVADNRVPDSRASNRPEQNSYDFGKAPKTSSIEPRESLTQFLGLRPFYRFAQNDAWA